MGREGGVLAHRLSTVLRRSRTRGSLERSRRFLLTKFRHQSGREIGISATFIDSGGHKRTTFTGSSKRDSHGESSLAGAQASRGKRSSRRFAQQSAQGEALHDRDGHREGPHFRADENPGPSSRLQCTFRTGSREEYLEQLTSEKAVRRYKKGRGAVREYLKTRERNEALDLEVYALAALYSLGTVKLRLSTSSRRYSRRGSRRRPKHPRRATKRGLHTPGGTPMTG